MKFIYCINSNNNNLKLKLNILKKNNKYIKKKINSFKYYYISIKIIIIIHNKLKNCIS